MRTRSITYTTYRDADATFQSKTRSLKLDAGFDLLFIYSADRPVRATAKFKLEQKYVGNL